MEIPGYEIKRKIGQGGMATAYLAEQQSLGRQVVLKILDTAARESAETVERFLNEGRIIAALNHPNIITIYDIGQHAGEVYISMEYVEGGDLKQRMLQKVFAPVEALDVIEKIASGLAVAHENGIVHRDVKPGNILFRSDGTPLLSDFGIAKRLSTDSDLTSTGMFLGSPNYMAPEQSEAGPIDGRADIYSLGVILFEMLSGTRAYQADSVIDVIVMHKKAPIPTLPEAFSDYQEMINLMMAKNRRERFRDANALLHFIDELRKTGLVKTMTEMTANPDFDITGEHDDWKVDTLSGTTRIQLEEKKLTTQQKGLIAALAVCALGWLVLLGVEYSMQAAEQPREVVQADIEPVGVEGETPALSTTTASAAERAQVGQALLWLGQHSLDDFRLTSPPRDNAYYYFSRLLQLDPQNTKAQAGMKKIATQFALLAERKIAEDRFEDARRYIAVGLQIAPQHESLLALNDLTTKPKAGFWGALGSLFE